jgi:hypothetical protein
MIVSAIEFVEKGRGDISNEVETDIAVGYSSTVWRSVTCDEGHNSGIQTSELVALNNCSSSVGEAALCKIESLKITRDQCRFKQLRRKLSTGCSNVGS